MDCSDEKSDYIRAWQLFEEECWAEALVVFDMFSIALRSESDVLHARAMCLARLGKEGAARFLCDQLTIVHHDPRGEELKAKISRYKKEGKTPPSSEARNRSQRRLGTHLIQFFIIVFLGTIATTIYVWRTGMERDNLSSEPITQLSVMTVQDISGEWECSWDKNQTSKCLITTHDKILELINENGQRSKGLYKNGTITITQGWESNLKGHLSADGKLIEWSNGSSWLKKDGATRK